MGCKQKIKDFIKGLDLFAQPVGFRFSEEPQYETFTGGICSIIMIVTFIAIFTGTTINTLNKQYISSTTTIFEQTDPTYYTIGSDNFMFAIGMLGIDLNEGQRWFDIYMQYRSYGNGDRNKTYMPLVKCEKQHWTTVNDKFGEVYDRLGFDKWLCPPLNSTFQLQGKYTSEDFKFYKFAVTQCDPSADLTRPCVNSSQIDTHLLYEQSFNFNFYFVNTIINSGSHEYISYYLEDMNYFPFSTTDGINANIFLSTYTITTDQSIYPVEDILNETGAVVSDLAQIHNFEVRQDEYLKVYLRKSSTDILVERSFRKADDTLSYIGGLFSAILAIMFLFSFYNEASYELEVAQNMYRSGDGETNSDHFNILTYLGYVVFIGCKKIGCELQWEKMKEYHQMVEEARKQMDVRLVLQRILYSERAIGVLLEDHQAKILQLQQPFTIEQAAEIRKDHNFYHKIQELYFSKPEEAEDDNEIESESNIRINSFRDFSSKKIHTDSNEAKSQEQEEFQDCERRIVQMKQNIKQLERQVEEGNLISRKILNRFDPRIKKQFFKKRKIEINKLESPMIIEDMNIDTVPHND